MTSFPNPPTSPEDYDALWNAYSNILKRCDELTLESEQIGDALGTLGMSGYGGCGPEDPGPDPHEFDIWTIQEMKRQHDALRKQFIDYQVSLGDLLPTEEGDRANDSLLDRVKRLASRVKSCTEWYAIRWETLWQYAKQKDIELFKEVCSIMANGAPTPYTPPSYAQLLRVAQMRSDAFKGVLEGFVKDFEMDYVYHGQIVDDPPLILRNNYDAIKKVLQVWSRG